MASYSLRNSSSPRSILSMSSWLPYFFRISSAVRLKSSSSASLRLFPIAAAASAPCNSPYTCKYSLSACVRFSAAILALCSFFQRVAFASFACTGVKYFSVSARASVRSGTMSRMLRSIVSKRYPYPRRLSFQASLLAMSCAASLARPARRCALYSFTGARLSCTAFFAAYTRRIPPRFSPFTSSGSISPRSSLSTVRLSCSVKSSFAVILSAWRRSRLAVSYAAFSASVLTGAGTLVFCSRACRCAAWSASYRCTPFTSRVSCSTASSKPFRA